MKLEDAVVCFCLSGQGFAAGCNYSVAYVAPYADAVSFFLAHNTYVSTLLSLQLVV